MASAKFGHLTELGQLFTVLSGDAVGIGGDPVVGGSFLERKVGPKGLPVKRVVHAKAEGAARRRIEGRWDIAF